MTKDLEMTLQELGPGYHAVVKRLQAGSVPVFNEERCVSSFFKRYSLLAASIILTVGLSSFFFFRPSVKRADAAPQNEYRLAEICDEHAVQEMIRTQNPDGSWQTDFLTRRNAAALASRSEIEARIAYKKAQRNLRNRGLL